MHPLDERLNELITILHSHAEEATSVSMHLRARGGQAMAAVLLGQFADIARTLNQLRSDLGGADLDAVVGGRTFIDPLLPVRLS